MTTKERGALTPTQEKILETLVLYTHEHKYQPSTAELAELCDLSSVQRQIDRLAALGWINITGNARAIEIPTDVYNSIVAKSGAAKKPKRKKK